MVTRNGSGGSRKCPKHVALSPIGVQALGWGHFLEMPSLDVGVRMRDIERAGTPCPPLTANRVLATPAGPSRGSPR